MEHAIILYPHEVRAALAGRLGQVRRAVKLPAHVLTPDATWIKSFHQDGGGNWVAWSCDYPGLAEFTKAAYPQDSGIPCPFGRPGSSLWVKEAYRAEELDSGQDGIRYRADNAFAPIENTKEAADLWLAITPGWRSPVTMPRWASRLTLVNTGVSVERLWQLTVNKMEAGGIEEVPDTDDGPVVHPLTPYIRFWDSVYGKRPGYAWDDNPWCWSVDVKTVGTR